MTPPNAIALAPWLLADHGASTSTSNAGSNGADTSTTVAMSETKAVGTLPCAASIAKGQGKGRKGGKVKDRISGKGRDDHGGPSGDDDPVLYAVSTWDLFCIDANGVHRRLGHWEGARTMTFNECWRCWPW